MSEWLSHVHHRVCVSGHLSGWKELEGGGEGVME